MREALARCRGLPYPGDSASFNCPFLSLDKLVSQLPSVVLRWQVGSLHKPPACYAGVLDTRGYFLHNLGHLIASTCRIRLESLHLSIKVGFLSLSGDTSIQSYSLWSVCFR